MRQALYFQAVSPRGIMAFEVKGVDVHLRALASINTPIISEHLPTREGVQSIQHNLSTGSDHSPVDKGVGNQCLQKGKV